MNGTVTRFDVHVGLGVIESETGESYPFHCVNIADGTRTIEVGAKVTFETFQHPRGRTEAKAIAQQ